MYGILLSRPGCYLELLGKQQKRISKTFGPSLAASLGPLTQF